MATTAKAKPKAKAKVAAKPRTKKKILKISGINYVSVKCSLGEDESIVKAKALRKRGYSARRIKSDDDQYCIYTPETSIAGTAKKAPKAKVAAKPRATKAKVAATKPKAKKATVRGTRTTTTKAKVAAKKRA
jgi:hypothetical protein